MTKSELKEMDNVLVELRCGCVLFVVGDYMIENEGFDELVNYSEDLTNICNFNNLDIVKVYQYDIPVGGFKGMYSLMKNNNRDYIKLVWERK